MQTSHQPRIGNIAVWNLANPISGEMRYKLPSERDRSRTSMRIACQRQDASETNFNHTAQITDITHERTSLSPLGCRPSNGSTTSHAISMRKRGIAAWHGDVWCSGAPTAIALSVAPEFLPRRSGEVRRNDACVRFCNRCRNSLRHRTPS